MIVEILNYGYICLSWFYISLIQEFHEKNLLEYRPEEASASQSAEPTVEADKEQADETQEPEPVVEALPQTEPTADTGDLLVSTDLFVSLSLSRYSAVS